MPCHVKYPDYDFQIEQWNNFFSPSYLRKAANIAEMPLYAQTFFGISLDFTNIQHSKNIYQRLTLKYHKNSFSIFCT